MRERLLLAFVALILVVVAAFMVVRGHAAAERIRDDQRHELERSAEIMAGLLPSSARQVSSERLRSLLYDGEQVAYVDANGHWVQAAQHATAADDEMPQSLSVARPVPGGGRVTLSLRGDVVENRIAAALLPIVVAAVVLAGAAIAVATWFARRLTSPFRELAQAAEAIGRGDFDVEIPRYRMPEADTVARVLRASASDLDALTRRERDFAAHASHALRTPITAARLELEDLAFAPGTPPEVVGRLSDAVEQLDRLNSTVAGMIDAGRVRVDTDIDFAALVRDVVERWRRSAASRRIVDACDTVVAVRLPVGSLMQVMDVLLGNAVTHGEGTIRVSVSQAAEYAEVRVSDEGPRCRALDGMKARDDGRLATATEIVESLGGHLRLTDDPATTFSLVLPLPRRETVAS
ncbi:MAG TPA: HAMP domain-containing sensor histidine kinase [Nocardioidaceae bacterium]